MAVSHVTGTPPANLSQAEVRRKLLEKDKKTTEAFQSILDRLTQKIDVPLPELSELMKEEGEALARGKDDIKRIETALETLTQAVSSHRIFNQPQNYLLDCILLIAGSTGPVFAAPVYYYKKNKAHFKYIITQFPTPMDKIITVLACSAIGMMLYYAIQGRTDGAIRGKKFEKIENMLKDSENALKDVRQGFRNYENSLTPINKKLSENSLPDIGEILVHDRAREQYLSQVRALDQKANHVDQLAKKYDNAPKNSFLKVLASHFVLMLSAFYLFYKYRMVK